MLKDPVTTHEDSTYKGTIAGKEGYRDFVSDPSPYAVKQMTYWV